MTKKWIQHKEPFASREIPSVSFTWGGIGENRGLSFEQFYEPIKKQEEKLREAGCRNIQIVCDCSNSLYEYVVYEKEETDEEYQKRLNYEASEEYKERQEYSRLKAKYGPRRSFK